MCMMESRARLLRPKNGLSQFPEQPPETPEILVSLYCPDCARSADFDPLTMVADCGWIMAYDMEGARDFFVRENLDDAITLELNFDEGYLTWQGFSPGDHEIRPRSCISAWRPW